VYRGARLIRIQNVRRSDETQIILHHAPSPFVTYLLLSLAIVAGTALVILVGFSPV
jgi:hypothetical protein